MNDVQICRLSENDRRVLGATEHDARLSVAAIAAACGMRSHSVSYTLKSLKERKLIRPYVLTNPHTLGLTDYCVFFNYAGEERQARKKIISYCTASDKVAYFGELTGPFQYSVSLFCRTVYEVSQFFDDLRTELPGASFETSLALRMRFTQFTGKRFESPVPPHILDRSRVEEETEIDEIDRKILAFYSQHAELPLKKVADYAGTTESTVRYRLKALEQNKVIEGYPYLFNVTRAGFSTFRVVIIARGDIRTAQSEIFDYMMQRPHGTTFVHCFGGWDFELNFEVPSALAIGSLAEQVQDDLSRHIRRAFILHEVAVHRAHHFPLEAGL